MVRHRTRIQSSSLARLGAQERSGNTRSTQNSSPIVNREEERKALLGEGPSKQSPPFSHYLLVFTVAFAVFANSLHGEFVYDDRFHLVNVLLHAFISCLFLAVSPLLIKRSKLRLFVSLLFAVHAVHCEAVSSIVGRADLLAALTVLAAVLIASNSDSVVMPSLLAAVGILCKETAVSLLPILSLYRLLLRKKMSEAISLLPAFLILCLLRLSVTSFAAPSFSPADNPISHHPSLLTRTITYLYLPVFHLQLIAWPSTLSFDWSMDAIPPVESVIERRAIATFILYVALIYTAYNSSKTLLPTLCGNNKKGRQDFTDKGWDEKFCTRLLLSFTLLAIPHLPASNLFTTVGFIAAERILYLPSAGFCYALGVIAENVLNKCTWLKERTRFFWISLAILLLGTMAVRTFNRNKDWRDDLRLFHSAVPINPPKALSNLGHALARRGRVSEAFAAYQLALKHRPNMADTHYNMGVLYGEQGNHTQAADSYLNAIRYRPAFTLAYLNLGITLRLLGREEDALEVYRRCTRVDLSTTKTLGAHTLAQGNCARNRGVLLAESNRHKEAIQEYRMAISLCAFSSPCVPSLLTLVSSSLSALNDYAGAAEAADSALILAPHYIPALLASAEIKLKQNNSHEGWRLLQSAAEEDSFSALPRLHLALAAAKRGDTYRARRELEKGLELNEKDAEILFFLASLERENGRPARAEELLRVLVSFHPTAIHTATLGAQLHANGKWTEAVEWYDKALEMNPTDDLTKKNLEKVRRLLTRNNEGKG